MIQKVKQGFEKFASIKRNVLILITLFAIGASIQSIALGTKTYVEGGKNYNRYNNYTIFEKSFHHLKDGKDLYILYPEEHWDLYKYTPTFSVFFGMFAIFPDWFGLNFWNIFNALILALAVYYLPNFNIKQKGIALLIMLIELMTSMQNEQSNPMMAGLLILAYGLLEHNKYFWAALSIVFSVYIKLFGLVGFALFLFYPKKLKLAGHTLFWVIALFLLPLLFVDIAQYKFLFESYWNMLSHDHYISYGYSVMGWIHAWFGIDLIKNLVVGIGAILFLVPLARFKMYNNQQFRFLTLISVLLWVVIFNHKAESPTFIIAMSGVALWYLKGEKNTLNIILFTFAFVFTTLSPTDIFPKFLREALVKPYMLKAFPCILIWCKVIYDMIFYKPEGQQQIA
jgi:hypothetical protein